MSAQPVVTFPQGGALSAPIGGVQFVTVRFDNVPDGGGASNVGYAPYVNLVIPTTGKDGTGAAVDDGISYLGATYLAVPLQQWVLTFNAAGQATHPYATTAAGAPLTVTGTPGDTLVVLRLPFGSFTPDQTPSDIQVSLRVSPLADLGAPLNLKASGGFAYGRDPLVNPAADNPVTGATTTLAVTPTVLELDKVYVGPEQETATGPSYPREWLVKALIAEGQTITKLVLTDRMPDGTVITGTSIVNGTGSVAIDYATGQVVATLTGSYTGGTNAPTLKIEFYVTEFLRDGITPVLDPATGAFRVLENNARLDAEWRPIDSRDPLVIFAIDPAGPEDIITAKSIAVQKAMVPLGTLKAGGTLEWTLDGQVSNYFNMDDLVLVDTLGDGQVYDASFAPTITMREGGAVLFSGTIDPANVDVVRNSLTGITTIRFDVSQEMRDRGLVDDVLNGRPGGVENQATVLVKFHSTIQESYISTNPAPSNEPLVDQGDPLVNGVDFDGVVDETNAPKGDDSSAGVVLPVSDVGKSIYAINGNTAFTPGPISAGDQITFRLTLDMPLTGAHDVALTDFLPLPVLRALAGMSFTDLVSAAVPGANQAKWGPGATYDTSGDPTTTPTISFDSASNFLKFDFGDAVAPGNPPSRIDLLFTVVVLDQEFGDGLLLTNQVTSTETNSFGKVSEDNAIVQFVLGEPELNITKGVIADSGAGTPTATAGPVTFSAPGTAGNRFTGTINSTNIKTVPIDANLTGADAGDRVSFAIVVENTGSSLKGAFDVLVRDTLPTGFELSAGGLNLRVTDGAGNAIPFTLEGAGLFDPAGGIRLGDAVNSGSVGAYSATSGDNIVIITYDLELVSDVPVFGADLINTATIKHFAAVEGGIDRTPYTPAADLADTATVITQAPAIAKFVSATSESHTDALAGNDNRTDATIGEIVTYRITVSVPEGRMTDFRIEDFLPKSDASGGGVMTALAGRFIGVTGLSNNSTFDETPTITLTDTDGVNGNDKVTFAFGNVNNKADTTATAPATITLEVDAVVRNNTLNARGDALTNTVTVSAVDPDAPGGRSSASATSVIEVVAPNLVISKAADRDFADASDTIKYTITLENRGVPATGNATSDFTARAWDVSLKDLLTDVQLDAIYQGATLTVTGIPAGRITYGATPVDITLDYLDPGEQITVRFDVVVKADADAGAPLDNTAAADGSSMDGTTSQDDRTNPVSASDSVVISAPTITKTIIATSDANTRGPAAEGVGPLDRHAAGSVDLRIGEVVTYEIRVRLPEGDSPDFRITDTLEDLLTDGNGTLTFVPGSLEVVSVGANLRTYAGGTVAAPGISTSNAGSTAGDDRFVLNFGNVRNVSNNTDTEAEVIVLRLKAVVNDVAQNNDAGALGNIARADTGGTGTPTTGVQAAEVQVDVVEPLLNIDKASTVVAGQALDAGAIVSYSITIRHDDLSDAPAYDLKVADLVPSGMSLVAGTLSATAGSISSSGNAISWSADQFLLGANAVVITYQAKLLDSVTPAQLLSNTATLVYDSNPADPATPGSPTPAEDLASRNYGTQDTETRTVVLAPTIDKSVAGTGDTNSGSAFGIPANPDAAPGETVTYRLTVTVGEGTQRLVISDSLPTGLTFTGASVETIGSTISGSSLAVGAAATSVAGGTYSFDFGTIVNVGDNDRDAGDTITILVNARVAANAVAGTTLTNTAKVETYAPGGGKPGLGSATDPAAIDVVRPDLVIVKDASPGTRDAGDLVTYTVTLSHAAGSTAAAYNLALQDILPAGVSLVAGSATASAGTASISGGTLSYSLGTFLRTDAPIVITYQGRLAASVVDGQSIINTAEITYASAPANGASVTESDPAPVLVDIVNSVNKTLGTTSFGTTAGSNVGVGEVVTFLVTATLGEGAQRIVLRDVLPTGLTYLGSELLSLGGITGSAVAVGAAGSYDAGSRTLSFALGDISNPFDNLSTAADQVTFRVTAQVADSAAGTSLTNTGAVVSSVPVNPYGITPGTNPVTVTEPETVTVVRASLGGIAFRDTNGDGIRGPGETALVAGIPVLLLNADGSPTGLSTVTAANGSYLFDALVPGSYRVQFGEAGLEKRTLGNQGGNDGVDSDASQANGVTPAYTLANGENRRDVDAGYYQLARIGDRVWDDTNGNGRQDDGATGIVGATVQLLDAGGTVVGTTTTVADGFYQFTGLVPGDYSIQVLPAGYTATPRNQGDEAGDSDVNSTGRSDVFNLESGEAELRLDAGFYRGAKLGGTVFEDVNGNGLQDGLGENGISGRLVTLLTANGASTGRTALTDASGNYLFDNLAPGTYSVTFAPSGVMPFTRANQGLDNGSDSDADPSNGRTEQVTLVSGSDDRTLDAGVYTPAAIGDRVWEDLDGDGQQDAGEPGIVGATVRLLNAAGTVIGTTSTAADGFYQFTGLAPADYRVEIVAPGYVPTRQDQGLDAGDSDIAANGRTGLVNLSSGETDSTVDGGLYRYASLGDKVFDDLDNDGIQDGGEPGLVGIVVNLLSADGLTVLATTTTGAGGLYSFQELAPGDYRVEFVAPADRAFAKKDQGGDAADSDADRTTGRTDVVTLASGQDRTDVDAGLLLLGDLTGRVWVDRDGDGIEDAGEAPRAGVTVNLLNANGTPTGRTTTTDATGQYLFEDLITGFYRVQVVAPAGERLTLANEGGDNTVDSDALPATGITEAVQVLPAQVTRDLDAGLYVPASLGDRIFLDLDADGVQDGNEPGLAGVTVNLVDALGAVIGTTQTGAGGLYNFAGLAPGQYGVRVVVPATYEVSPRDAGNDATDSDALPNGNIPPVMLFSGDARTDLDAGLFQRVAIGDRVWRDLNGNGVQDGGEPGARGVTVRLLDAGGTVIATTVTALNGSYGFDNLLPGTYSVQFLAPGGSVFTTRDVGSDSRDSDADLATGRTQQVTLTSGQENNTLDAGLVFAASIGDRVWADRDGDGQQDPEEPGIGNVIVRLLNLSGTVIATTTTDASGFYLFDGLRPGDYVVRFNTPAGHIATGQNIGNDATDSDAAPNGRTGTITLAPGDVVTHIDAGFIPDVVGTCDLPGIVLTNGNDGFPGTEAGDKVDGLAGNDNINGLRGDDCLRGNDGNDAINGHEGGDKIQGDGGDDNLHGNAGNDVIYGGDGNDTIEAGEGNDWAEGGAGNDAMQGEGGDDTLFGGLGNDIVEANAGNDIAFGGAGNDRVTGHDGNDTVLGGTDFGRASFIGGNITGVVIGDTVSGDGGADRFIWQKGDGVDLLLDFKPSEGDTLTIYGYAAPVAVQRVDGRAVIYLGTDSAIVMNDFYPTDGSTPGITFVPGTNLAPGLPAERAPITGTTGNDTIAGNGAANVIEGLQGKDVIGGGGGNDTIYGGDGDDALNGGPGGDLLDGGAGIDTVSYGSSPIGVRASLAAPAGNTGIAAGDSYVQVENLLGSAHNDTLVGDNGNNRLAGADGNDMLSGGGGLDELLGGLGADRLAGGAGADRFLFYSFAESSVAASDTILDFSWFEGDKINLSPIDGHSGQAGNQAFAFVGTGAFAGGGQGSVRYEQDGADTLVLVDAGDGGAAEMAIRLAGLHTLFQSDFNL
jgi:fimbrial isopeptide formation D2 family protein/uncharacterized repeat protein (TIGR01451 family)